MINQDPVGNLLNLLPENFPEVNVNRDALRDLFTRKKIFSLLDGRDELTHRVFLTAVHSKLAAESLRLFRQRGKQFRVKEEHLERALEHGKSVIEKTRPALKKENKFKVVK